MRNLMQRLLEPGRVCAARGQRGFSVTEMTVSLALLSLISLIFFTVYVGLLKQSVFNESHNNLTTDSQQALNRIRSEVIQSRTVFERTTAGNAYLAAVQFPAEAPLLTDSRLPRIDANGVIGPDTVGNRKTGNILFMARQMIPLELALDHDADATTADISYLTDVYRFELFYLSENGRRPFNGRSHYLDLIQARSPIYADYFQLNGLTAAQRTQLVSELVDAGVTVAWDPSQPVASALYTLNDDGSISGPSANPAIGIASWSSMFPQFAGGSISGSIDYSVAPMAFATLATHDPVPLYAITDNEFPGGFEVQMVGPTGARKLLSRVALMAHSQRKVTIVAGSVTAATAQF